MIWDNLRSTQKARKNFEDAGIQCGDYLEAWGRFSGGEKGLWLLGRKSFDFRDRRGCWYIDERHGWQAGAGHVAWGSVRKYQRGMICVRCWVY